MASGNLDVIQSVPQVATLIYKAHKLWHEFRDVPEKISSLVTQLKAMELMFQEIEETLSHGHASPGFTNCLRLSKEAYDSLEALVLDMDKQLDVNPKLKRKLAAVKVMLNKSMLDRLERGLTSCLSMLQLAIQSYTMAMLSRLTPETIAMRVRSEIQVQIQQPLPQAPQQKKLRIGNNHTEEAKGFDLMEPLTVEKRKPRPPLHTPSQFGRFSLAYTGATGAWRANVQLPNWFSTAVYEVLSSPSISGWTCSYRMYNVIPEDAEIVMKVRAGDVFGVRELFSTKRASPFDRNSDGNSLLHHAAFCHQYEVCQLLLHMGLHSLLDEQTKFGSSPLGGIVEDVKNVRRKRDHWKVKAGGEVLKVAALFASYVQQPDALPSERLLDFVREFEFHDSLLSVFQELFMPKYYFRMLRDRLEAMRLGAFTVIDAMTFERLLSADGSVTTSDVAQSTRERLSLVHSAATAFACRFTEELIPYKRPIGWARAYSPDWGQYVMRVVSAATANDLHSIERVVPCDGFDAPCWTGTPLASVIGGVLTYLVPNNPFNHWDIMFHGVLRQWLGLLKSAGVDLAEYGCRERSILRGDDDTMRGAFDATAMEGSRTIPRHSQRIKSLRPRLGPYRQFKDVGQPSYVPFRIIDLKYGPSPDDWELSWALEFEHFAAEFWRLIETEEERMPGAWVEG